MTRCTLVNVKKRVIKKVLYNLFHYAILTTKEVKMVDYKLDIKNGETINIQDLAYIYIDLG